MTSNVSINFYTKRLSAISWPKYILTLTITQNKDYKFIFLSHNIYDYKSMPNVWINKARMNLKFNECCILDYKLNDNIMINPCFNLIELIYSWSWKIAVVDFLPEIGSLLTIIGYYFDWSKWPFSWISNNRLTVWNYRIAVNFQNPAKIKLA